MINNNKQKKNAIFFVTGLDSGGIENYLLRFIQEKHNSFKSITVYCKRKEKQGQLEQDYLKYSNVFIKKDRLSFFNLLNYIKLYFFFKKEKYDMVCDFTGNFAGLIMKVASLANIKNRVTFYRGSVNHFEENKLKVYYNDWINKLVYKHSTLILSNSKAAFNFFFPKVWKNNKKFKVLYNGINTKKFTQVQSDLRESLNIPREAFVVGHTGRYNVAKNHETIIKVAEELVKRNENLYFMLCGNGVEKNLKQNLKQKKLDKKILVFENRTDIPSFLKTMNVYLFPSITEGQPNSLIEAMLMGLPFVASNIEPIKEMVPTEFYTYLTEPKDWKKQVDLIEQFKIHPMLREQRQKIKEHIIVNFNAKEQFQKFLKYLTE